MKLRPFFLLLLALGLVGSIGISSAQDTSGTVTQTETGHIGDDAPFTVYTITVDQSGSTLIADITGANDDRSLDTLLYLVDSNGLVVTSNDDRPNGESGDLTSRLEFPQASAGDYRVIATRYKVLEGSAEGDYDLTIEIVPPTEIDVPDYAVDDASLVAAGYPQVEPRPRSEYVVLAYYGGDNNLESSIINDVIEFERGFIPGSSVRVVVLLDRSPLNATTSGDWSGTRLFEVAPADPANAENAVMSSTELGALGDGVNTGSGETLAQFLVWGIQNFPADNYIVSIGSHGIAWQGVVVDDSDDETYIDLPSVREAFQTAQDTVGGEKFTLLINDACYMGSVEYQNVVSPFFDYSLASPEVVINPGHSMTVLTQTLIDYAQRGTPTTETGDLLSFEELLGENLADTYLDRDLPLQPGPDVAYATSAVIDLSQFDAVRDAVIAFADFVAEDPISRGSVLGQARANAYVYSGYKGDNELVDLGSLMTQVITLLTDPVENAEFIAYAQNVRDALDAAVPYGRGGVRTEGRVNGYQNIYFPLDANKFDADYFQESLLPEWGAMLRAIYSAATPKPWDAGGAAFAFHPPVVPELRITGVYPADEVSVATNYNAPVEVVGRNIVSGTATYDLNLPDGTVQRLSVQIIDTPTGSWASGLTETNIIWDARLPQLTDGTNTHFERIDISDDVATLQGQYRASDSEDWTPVTLLFDRTTGLFSRAISTNTETGSAAVIEIPDGVTFQAFSYLVTADGHEVVQPGNLYTFSAEAMHWSDQPAPDGNYNIGLRIRVFGGLESSKSVSAVVNNGAFAPELRVITQTFFGFIVPTYKGWTPLYVRRAPSGFFYTATEDDALSFRVFAGAEQVTATEPIAIAEEVIAAAQELYPLEISETTPITLPDGVETLQFEYTRQEEDRLYTGRGFATYYPGTSRDGWLFTAETTGDAVELDAIYPTLVEHAHRFSPDDIIGVDESRWSLTSMIENTYHPVVEGWAQVDPAEGEFWINWITDEASSTGFFAEGEFNINTSTTRNDARDAIFDSEIQPDLLNPEVLLDSLTYTGYFATWSALTYTGERDGVAVQGRLYVTLANQRAYALWFETSDDNAGQDLTSQFEIVVDGYQIDNVPLELLGVRSTLVNLGPQEILAASNDEPALLLRYDGRSVAIFNRLPDESIDISDVAFVQYAADGTVIASSTMGDFDYGDKSNVRPQDCYQRWALGYADLPVSNYPTDICNFRQGFGRLLNPFWTSSQPGQTFQVVRGSEVLATCLAVRPIDYEDYDVDNPNIVRRQCLVDLDTSN